MLDLHIQSSQWQADDNGDHYSQAGPFTMFIEPGNGNCVSMDFHGQRFPLDDGNPYFETLDDAKMSAEAHMARMFDQ